METSQQNDSLFDNDTLNSDGLEAFRLDYDEPANSQLPQENEVTEETEQENRPVEPDLDNWQVRASYFQSQLDKYRNQVEPYMPLIQYVQQTPQALEVLEKIMMGQQTPLPQQEPVQNQDIIAKPDKPSKPSNYNVTDAFNDPDSESFKYREAMDDYKLAMIEHYEKKDEANNKAVDEIVKQRTMQMQTQEKLMEADTLLQSKYNFSPEDSVAFIKEMGSNDSLSMDNLVGYWKWKRSQVNGGQQKVQQLNQNNNRPKFPLPAAIAGGGGNNPAPDINSQFNQTFFQRRQT
jgi:hypothetical protein